jgi:hypothetical protein
MSNDYINYYECPSCLNEWTGKGDYYEHGECPDCGDSHPVTPYESQYGEAEDE